MCTKLFLLHISFSSPHCIIFIHSPVDLSFSPPAFLQSLLPFASLSLNLTSNLSSISLSLLFF